LPVFREIFTYPQIALGIHYLFLLLGGMVGAFGLIGREFMNRRFGQASLIAYSSRSLPVSERLIFANFLVKDIVYYFVLYVLPFIAGFSLALTLIPAENFHFPVALLLITLSLSFMIGLSLVFFLSTIYAHSGKLLTLGFLAGLILLIFISKNLNPKIFYVLPSLSFFLFPSQNHFLSSFILIIIPLALSLIFLKVDFPSEKKSFPNSFTSLCRKLGSYRYAAFVTKDFLDLKRSEGGLGKLIFSLFLPAFLLWMLLSAMGRVLLNLNTIILFSLVLGVLSSSMYNWLTEYDIFASYAFLPLKVSDMIKSKLNSYIFLNLIPLIILVLFTLEKDPESLLPALLIFLSISLYMVSVVIYLTGLSPSINLYNGKTFAIYILSVMPLLLENIILSMFGSYYELLNLLLIPLAFYLLWQSFKKWDLIESSYF
jgi:hypothetical protein